MLLEPLVPPDDPAVSEVPAPLLDEPEAPLDPVLPADDPLAPGVLLDDPLAPPLVLLAPVAPAPEDDEPASLLKTIRTECAIARCASVASAGH